MTNSEFPKHSEVSRRLASSVDTVFSISTMGDIPEKTPDIDGAMFHTSAFFFNHA